MLALDIQCGGRSLSVELPMSTNILIGELRAIGIHDPLDKINRNDFLLQSTNDLGEHFMRLVRPDDTLQTIATACREFDVLANEPRQALIDLIKNDRLRSLEHMTDYLQYGSDALAGLIRLTRGDRSVILPTSQINLCHAFGTKIPMGLTRLAEAELAPVSETGRRLIAEFQPYSDTIATANVACELAMLPDLRANIKSVVASARMFQLPMETEALAFYCPLLVRTEDDAGAYYVDADPDLLIYHEDEIRDALRDEIPEGDNMAEYIHDDTLKQKVASAAWDIAKIGPAVYGKITCELRAPLTDAEQEKLTDWIASQNSDGLGEGWEQRPIETDDGDLYVSFWHDGEDYYLLPEDEFRAQVLEPQLLEDQSFGVMTMQ